MFNFAMTNTRVGGGGDRPGPGERRDPGERTPEPLPESPEYPPESPVEGPPGGPPGSSPGSGRGSSSDTGAPGGTSATPVEAGSFARPGMMPQMAAFNTLAPASKLAPRGGPGQVPIGGAPGEPVPGGASQTLDDLLRKLGLLQ